MNGRSGKYRTNLSGEAVYRSFVPSPLLPAPRVDLDAETVELLIKANKQIALLEGSTNRIPSINLFISMYVRKEALMSSQIEGTQATLEDVLDPHVEENANRDVGDVINYIKATEFAVARLGRLPLCNRLIKEAHAVLMKGVRGQDKDPGAFRRSQNWIGVRGSTLQNAGYIPPNVEDMSQAMSDLERYINSDDDLDVLVRAALIHYQFETIHPFLDGNGRIGRLLITLFLMEQGVLTTPALYISYYLKKNRVEYYDRMNDVRRKGTYEQWVKFFLRALYDSAADATETIERMSSLHDESSEIVSSFGRGEKTARRLLAYLEEKPIMEIKRAAEDLGVTFKTVSNAIMRMQEAGILLQTGGNQRNRIFSYEPYLALLREGT
ncbi:MAG: Fic family protein [Coriobacteriia bacterium]|nr:Fic family protein [Coriobacteriia bacterium]